MPYKKGQSGNPNGRPLKNRALTALLEAAGDKTIDAGGGKRVARKRILADVAWQLATEARAILPNGTVLDLAPKEWLDVYKFIYQQVDGPPKSEVDLTSDGEKIIVRLSSEE